MVASRDIRSGVSISVRSGSSNGSHNGYNVDMLLRSFRTNLQREQIFRKMKMSRFYMKPSEKRVLEQQESDRRKKKNKYRRRVEGY